MSDVRKEDCRKKRHHSTISNYVLKGGQEMVN